MLLSNSEKNSATFNEILTLLLNSKFNEAKELIQKENFDINHKYLNNTLLISVIIKEQSSENEEKLIKITNFLIENGIDINYQGKNGSALGYASVCGEVGLMRLLIEEGAKSAGYLGTVYNPVSKEKLAEHTLLISTLDTINFLFDREEEYEEDSEEELDVRYVRKMLTQKVDEELFHKVFSTKYNASKNIDVVLKDILEKISYVKSAKNSLYNLIDKAIYDNASENVEPDNSDLLDSHNSLAVEETDLLLGALETNEYTD